MAVWLFAVIAVSVGAASLLYIALDQAADGIFAVADTQITNQTSLEGLNNIQTAWDWAPLIVLIGIMLFGFIAAVVESNRRGI